MFEFTEYGKDQTKVFVALDTMIELQEQNSLELMGMKSQGKFVEYFITIVEDWRIKLGRVETVVNLWLKV